MMFNVESKSLPDLIVGICPQGCNGTCALIWVNETIEHKIVCNCECHQRNKLALAGVERPNAKAIVACSHLEIP